MNLEDLQQHWALVVASVIGLAVLLLVGTRLVLGSRGARLNARLRELRGQEKAAVKAGRAVSKAAKKLERLQRRAQSVKPRLIDEAWADLEDARALHKIASDQVLIAQNLVRKIIVEEYPPKRHEALRKRWLRDPERDARPFEMDG